jgi:DNA (cytosine-5)-methyltransferase 1
MKQKPKVIDFFCGAGGFSEGFRQQGFEIVMGIDNWMPAVETHNLNHDLQDQKKDVLDFSSSIEEIDNLPNTEIIIGSPPCVLFSLSNKGGKADKTLGINLIESFLRVIAVKKNQPSSKLVAWFMENVPNSRNYVKQTYTFRDLNLAEWAKKQKINPDKIALNGSINGRILNTADFGTSQKRERFVCGEIVSTGKFPNIDSFIKKEHRSIGAIKSKMPNPNSTNINKIYSDPNYPKLKLKVVDITDHFYDSGVYASQWKNAKDAKINHPFMGRMSFPEDENNPSRTIMATRSASTREALIYKSEYNRHGDGEYRLPTIREIATLMGFPYTYQFSGGENTKWRQIGNAVCPYMSASIAKSVRLSMGLKLIPDSQISFLHHKKNDILLKNLNTFLENKFDNPPKKNNTARFRKHPFKEGNMTVALTNFNPATSLKREDLNWYSAVFCGTGKGFIIEILRPNMHKDLQNIILNSNRSQGKRFIADFNKRFSPILNKVKYFQSAYTNPSKFDKNINPDILIDRIADLIRSHKIEEGARINISETIAGKSILPLRQIYAMFAINKLISSQYD